MPIRTINISGSQRVNACTIISIAAIHAILSSWNDIDELRKKLIRSHDLGENMYSENHSNLGDGAGVLIKDAYFYFRDEFSQPQQIELIAPFEEINLKEVIRNRDSFLDQEGELDYTFFEQNEGVINAVVSNGKKKFPNGVNWCTVTQKELSEIFPINWSLDKNA